MGPGLRVILGTMTFAGQTTKEEAISMLERFLLKKKHKELDTARMYEKGATERMLGEILSEREDLALAAAIATKANPFKTHDKSLSRSSAESQMSESLAALGTDAVDIYYLHAPDPETPILETLAVIDAAHKAGKFREFGLSNYQAWEVAHIHALCRERGFVVPTLYQGMLNLLTRDVERELLPCLRALGMRFYAYNPLAGGLLTGKYSRADLDSTTEGRFAQSNKMYRERYLHPAQLDAVDAFVAACDDAGIKPAHAALQWLVHHADLRDGDGIILGASKLAHFDDNLAALDRPPLPADVLQACDRGWALIKAAGICPSYERGHSLYAAPDAAC
mmetsp:Transcript_19559/g.61505  ORF Transcript_19559/g.61505 Transcript_19559/m.61505 type:complete len:335 (+) Transcript_19559:42-1046(+)